MFQTVSPWVLLSSPEGAGAPVGQQGVGQLLVIGALLLIFYFLMIRPQSKKRKQTEAMLAALKKGDKVATIGGIRGTVFSVKSDAVVLKVDDDTKIQFARNAISQILNESDAKAAEPDES